MNGLQGNALELVRPQNTPPFNSYFLNYTDPAEQPGLMGQIGGIAIWQSARARQSRLKFSQKCWRRRICVRAVMRISAISACRPRASPTNVIATANASMNARRCGAAAQ